MSNTQKEISKTLYKALNHKYNNEYLTAKSSVLGYFTCINSKTNEENNETNNYEEMDKLIEKMTNSKNKLKILEDTYKIALSLMEENEYRRASP